MITKITYYHEIMNEVVRILAINDGNLDWLQVMSRRRKLELKISPALTVVTDQIRSVPVIFVVHSRTAVNGME